MNAITIALIQIGIIMLVSVIITAATFYIKRWYTAEKKKEKAENEATQKQIIKITEDRIKGLQAEIKTHRRNIKQITNTRVKKMLQAARQGKPDLKTK